MVGILTATAQQKNGYKIKINFKQPLLDNTVYLANYFAKPMPTVYSKDSATVAKHKQEVLFQSNDSIHGGIYLVFFNNKNHYIELVLDNGDQLELTIDTTLLPLAATYKNSAANEDYIAMNRNFIDLRDQMTSLKQQVTQGKIDNATYQATTKKKYEGVYQANLAIANKHDKNALIRKIIYAVTPVSEALTKPFKADGKTIDSAQIAYLLKEQYWDNYDLSDDRLIYSPLYENKLKYYIENYVHNFNADSLIYEAEKLLYFTRNAKEHFKFTLNWLTQYAHNSKIMGIDEVFVHLVEQYYMVGKADWLDNTALDTYIKRAQSLAPNVLGKKGADFRLKDVFTLAPYSLYEFEAPYTLLVFWSIDCSSCINEIPKLKSLYDQELKGKNVRVLSVPSGKTQKLIQDAIKQYGLEEWKHIIDVDGTSDYMEQYDAYAKPKIYLLDKDKMIRGKLLNHTNIEQVLNNEANWK